MRLLDHGNVLTSRVDHVLALYGALAGALCDLRNRLTTSLNRPNWPITDIGLPLNTEYADDVILSRKGGQRLCW